jgi:phenylacetic acid degradation operon negative regulatory protein
MPRHPPAPDHPPSRRVSPARQALTLFGDYWWSVPEPIPSGALVAALFDLGVKEAAARATLTRLTRLGLLDQGRTGRRTTYGLSERAREIVDEEARWLDTFGRVEPEWDGVWSVVAFTIPEARRAVRHAARSQLRWLGFAPLYDGVWISPLDAASQAKETLVDLGADDVTSMRASLDTTIPGGPQSAWDTDAALRRYAAFDTDLRAVADVLTGAEALAVRSGLMLSWQGFRGIDVGLPTSLLPGDWPRAEARRLFAERYHALGPSAEGRMSAHIEAISPELAGKVTSRSLA